MKFLNFRIDTQWVKGHNTVPGWFVLGQSNKTYNWRLLHEAASFEAAKEFIRGIKDNDRQNVYGPDGYAIKM